MVRIIARLISMVFCLARWVFIGLSIITPWVLRTVWFTTRLMALSVVSLVVGVPTAVSRISSTWMSRAVAIGFPTEYDTILYYLTSIAAFLTLLSGWIILAVITVGAVLLIGNAIVN